MTLLVRLTSGLASPLVLSEPPAATEVIARTVVWARPGAGHSSSTAALTLIAVSNDDEWLRTARRVLVNQPGTVGLLSVGAPVDSTAVSRRLAEAMARLTGKSIGLFPHWRCWGATAGVVQALPTGVVVLSPPAPGGEDPVAAVAALETAVSHARLRFAHLLLDLAGLPLRHPPTLACADVMVTLAAPGGVREEHLLALERLLPADRNLGVMLID
jgi:hypothetical protein